MPQHTTKTQTMADGYYSEDDLGFDSEELDLSFLDEEE